MIAEPYFAISGQTAIPVQNVWLLLLYASEFYRAGHASLAGIEGYPDKLPDLLGEILVASVEDRLRKPLSPEFAETKGDLRRVRGRIDVLRTESHQLLSRGRVACHFEELSVDTPRNRLARAALSRIARLVKSRELSRRCADQVNALNRRGVSGVYQQRDVNLAQHRVTRNNAGDQRMIRAAQLAMQLSLPADFPHTRGHHRENLSIEEFRGLFEKAVGGFFSATLDPRVWSVDRGKKLTWHEEDPTSGLRGILPGMEADVILRSATLQRRLLLDTKFTDVIKRGRYDRSTLKSGHLYQLYAYIRTQENPADPLSLSSEGILLYPSTGTTVQESFSLSGHRFTAATVDLADSAIAIRSRLLEIVQQPTDGSSCLPAQ